MREADVSARLSPVSSKSSCVRTCVIFNPTARGEKARRFRRHLEEIGRQCVLRLTAGPGDARRLAAEAGAEGFEVVVAAGGDGTVNEVLNGLAVAAGQTPARLGVLPLGTVNVFARELGLPLDLPGAWRTIQAGKSITIDLPEAVFESAEGPQRRWFAQLAGAGLDARAIELVRYSLKKRIGPLAYVVAGLQALAEAPSVIRVSGDSQTDQGSLVLIGNGRLYGGNYRLFPQADLQDGLLDVCVFPRVDVATLIRCAPSLLLSGKIPGGAVRRLQAREIVLEGGQNIPFELDGEWAGRLPVRFTLRKNALRVIVP
jgi:YegS/Rv2252/BmrU family lipid kinase